MIFNEWNATVAQRSEHDILLGVNRLVIARESLWHMQANVQVTATHNATASFHDFQPGWQLSDL